MTRGNKIFIIAEAGVNHNGDLDTAKKLAIEAKRAGADAVKFQTFIAEQSVSIHAPKADYQIRNTSSEESQFDMVKKLELSFAQFIDLNKFCEDIGIMFLSTAFDLGSLDFLTDEIGIPIIKIPSGEITNLLLLTRAGEKKRPILMSTGMSDLDEVRGAYDALVTHGAEDITLLQCTTEYPAPPEDVNLLAMQTMKEEFGCEVGYSDHTVGIDVAIAAAALGASVIEKHFTFDRTADGLDHRASLEPHELRLMIESIRRIEVALGDGVKRVSHAEEKNREIARKSIIASREINRGEVFTAENLDVKRPGTGLSPMKWFEVIGETALRDYEKDELIEL
jgi:N,N'-diacetyllegionaminate synthase